jgi:hypothetical protein
LSSLEGSGVSLHARTFHIGGLELSTPRFNFTVQLLPALTITSKNFNTIIVYQFPTYFDEEAKISLDIMNQGIRKSTNNGEGK